MTLKKEKQKAAVKESGLARQILSKCSFTFF